MTFHYTAEEGSIHVEGNHILKARLQRPDGEYQDAEIDLNNHIGNENGSFFWDGENFSDSAEDVHFTIEGEGEVPVLRATLHNADGEGVQCDLNLAERISNNDGSFVFSE
ncbi:Cyanovirin-N [Bimuria novae-zelandiae CBS 107.79]|uniref:Cyanovirin-N n=1 Tax=Bimuria novae-zelandiae CBS 107.79 TaxID=1447943 RepID=A0A6A5UQ80_9PLEO|nr:Cyanovirin-N [Bimuria novae-zelandiae CBS 107.79]